MMSEVLCEFFTWAVKDVFSGDVQTTTLAVAITSSLCCSIVVAVVHIIALIKPPDAQRAKMRNHFRSDTKSALSSKRDSPVWFSCGKVRVPCVKCGNFFADDGCRFVTCKACCFSVLVCQVHQKKMVSSTPCDRQHTEMDLSSVGMETCPERLGFIGHQLTCLNLSDNKLVELPSEIGCLRGLQVLSIHRNKLSTLPDTISSLVDLACFNISHNEFHVFPSYVTSLSNLQEVNMSHNHLSELPSTFSSLKNLIVLDISHNNISKLCIDLFSLYQLKVLNISHNQLEELPMEIGRLIKLVSLEASSCCLHSLPSAIGDCTSLASIQLNDNKLKRLPSKLGQLCNLQTLQVERNHLKYLPYSLSTQQDRLQLSVQGNPLLEERDYENFTFHPEGGTKIFPQLKELAARWIIKANIPTSQTLPGVLQDLLHEAGSCSVCGGPVCEFYQSKVLPVHFTFPGDWYPLYKQLCSPHKPQGCG